MSLSDTSLEKFRTFCVTRMWSQANMHINWKLLRWSDRLHSKTIAFTARALESHIVYNFNLKKIFLELGLNSIVIDRGPNLGHLGHAPRALNGSRNLVHALSGPGSGYLGVHSKILLYFPTSGSFKRP